MRTKEEILAEADRDISREAEKNREEVGLGCSVLNIFDESGKMVAYRVIVRTDNGLEKVFPDVPATEPPGDAIAEAHLEIVDEIRKRRAERRALPTKMDPERIR